MLSRPTGLGASTLLIAQNVELCRPSRKLPLSYRIDSYKFQRLFPQTMNRISRLFGQRKPTLTLYHNAHLKLLHHLLSRLKNKLAFRLDIVANQVPDYNVYKFLHEQCNVHPQNAKCFEHVFPALLHLDHTFDEYAARGDKRRQFVPDLELMEVHEYKARVDCHKPAEVKPFVVDWINKLVAADDKSLDTILANHRSCGMQTSPMVHVAGHEPDIVVPATVTPAESGHVSCGRGRASTTAAMAYLVHPHVAEFADLF